MQTKLGVAVVGLGRWGTILVRAFGAVPRARVVALCDTDEQRLRAAQGPSGPAVLRTSSFEQVLRHSAVDAVVVATPPATHAPLSLEALGSGRHVFVEKPMTTCSSDAERLVAAAREAQRVLMVGHILEHHPAVQTLCERVRRGDLGALRRVETQRLGAASVEVDPWWNLGPHDLSVLRLLLGPPLGIRVRRREQAGRVVATLEYAGGVQATITVGAECDQKTRRITVVGSRRTAVFDDTCGSKLRIYDHSGGRGEVPGDGGAQEEPLVRELERFVRGVLDGEPVGSDGLAGAEVVAVLQRGDEAMETWGRNRVQEPLRRDEVEVGDAWTA